MSLNAKIQFLNIMYWAEEMESLPCYIFVANIQKYKEAFVIWSISFMSSEHGSHFFQGDQIYHMYIDFLGNGRRIQWIRYYTAFRPRSAINVQVPKKNLN